MLLYREDIKQVIPHREPFLLIDEVDVLVPGKSAVGRWKVTGEEDFFRGHFPGMPVLPGVLIVESMAQTGAVVVLMMDKYKGKVVYFAGIQEMRFKRRVSPGDLLEIHVEIENIYLTIGQGKGTVFVDGEKAAAGSFKFAIGS